jgi:hypothetical protein
MVIMPPVTGGHFPNVEDVMRAVGGTSSCVRGSLYAVIGVAGGKSIGMISSVICKLTWFKSQS